MYDRKYRRKDAGIVEKMRRKCSKIKKSWKKQNEMGPSISNVSAVKEVI